MNTYDIVGTVITRVSGGVPTSDVSVREWDVRAVIPAAINYAITQDYYTNLRLEGDNDLPGSFFTEYEDLPIISDSKGRAYVDFDQKIINIGVNRGVRFVRDDCGGNYYPLPDSVSPKSISCYWGNIMPDNRYYKRTGKRIYLHNQSPLAEHVNVGAVADASTMDPEDELPIPAGYEPQVLDILVAFFKDQRFTPKDYIIDGRDLFSRGAQ